LIPSKPVLILLYGFPGAGKTFFARQLAEHLQAAHVQSDRIRGDLFEQPRYDKEENQVVSQLMDYMTGEFLHAGVSVIYDASAARQGQRRILRDMARQAHAMPILVWLQVDPETALLRATKRDRRKADDKYARPMDRANFERLAAGMQNPQNEEYIVTSGKHAFGTQLSAFVKYLREQGLVPAERAATKVVKPGLVNLVPTNTIAGRVDLARRNITIR